VLSHIAATRMSGQAKIWMAQTAGLLFEELETWEAGVALAS
jgi:hypothetical protein